MLSLIICSKKAELSHEFVKNLTVTSGVPVELIHIDNSSNRYSISEAYNLGIKRATGEYLCFVHEDVRFVTHDWGKALVAHLHDPETGVIGIAGTRLITRIPADWPYSDVNINIVQHLGTDTIYHYLPDGYLEKRRQVVVLDGVLLGMRRSLTEKIGFDESLPGFHGYDLDISLQSVLLGYRNYVVYDVLLEHFSTGKKSTAYYQNLIDIYHKHEKKLPLSIDEMPDKKTCRQIDSGKIKMLMRRLMRRKFSFEYIWILYKDCLRKSGISLSGKQQFRTKHQMFLQYLLSQPLRVFHL